MSQRSGADLDAEIRAVVDADLCSGCGACCRIDDGLSMELDASGFVRPARSRPPTAPASSGTVPRFRAVCPGVELRARRPEGSRRHPTMGPWLAAWQAWATDPEIRHRGSSGGTLTALLAWLAETGEAAHTVAAGAERARPERTVSVRITSREEALAAAGSRYAPVGVAATEEAETAPAFTGKPCEVAAVRRLVETGGPAAEVPLLLSFYCAGTPSQHATERLLDELGAERPVAELWYRGRGWPGSFTAVGPGGASVATSYDESWGNALGPSMQWRCKICPDGVGESSDVTAADFWATDERGYPDFTEGAGTSALIARTARGLDVVRRAIAAGVIEAQEIDLDDLARVQPFQRRRRTTLWGRLLGARLAGRRSPRYRGFGLLRFALEQPRETVRTARGSRRRVLAQRR